jgi:hypothetical protein
MREFELDEISNSLEKKRNWNFESLGKEVDEYLVENPIRKLKESDESSLSGETISSSQVTVVDTIERLRELKYSQVASYKEQYLRFVSQRRNFDHIGNIDAAICHTIPYTLMLGGMDEQKAMNWKKEDFKSFSKHCLKHLRIKRKVVQPYPIKFVKSN